MEEDKVTTENETLKENSSDVKSWGGARPNAGRPKGSENEETRKKRVVEEEFKQRVLRSADKLISSQMNLAQGVQMLYVIEKTEKGANKKPRLITDQETIESYLAGELDGDPDEYYFITTERPDNRALDSLFDRVFGKSVNNIDVKSDGKELKTVVGFNYIVPKENDNDNSNN